MIAIYPALAINNNHNIIVLNLNFLTTLIRVELIRAAHVTTRRHAKVKSEANPGQVWQATAESPFQQPAFRLFLMLKYVRVFSCIHQQYYSLSLQKGVPRHVPIPLDRENQQKVHKIFKSFSDYSSMIL